MTVCARPPFFFYPASVSVTNDLKGVPPPECPAAYTQPTRSFRFAFSVANMSQVKIRGKKEKEVKGVGYRRRKPKSIGYRFNDRIHTALKSWLKHIRIVVTCTMFVLFTSQTLPLSLSSLLETP